MESSRGLSCSSWAAGGLPVFRPQQEAGPPVLTDTRPGSPCGAHCCPPTQERKAPQDKVIKSVKTRKPQCVSYMAAGAVGGPGGWPTAGPTTRTRALKKLLAPGLVSSALAIVTVWGGQQMEGHSL